jgi:hypothetical protein
VKSRNPDVIWTVHQETRGEILFHRKIGNRELDAQRTIALQKLRYAISRNPEKTCEPSISEDRWQQINASSHRHSGFQVVKEIWHRNSRNRDTRYSDKISAVHLTGHVANIEQTVGVSAFGVSSCQRNLASQLAKSRYAKSRSDLSRPFDRTRGEHQGNRRRFGNRGFTLTEIWSIASRDIPRLNQDRPSFKDAWRKSEGSGKVPKRKSPSAYRDSANRES